MQNELAGMDIKILGVNQIGAVGGNGAIVDGRDIPWLEDTVDDYAWDLWQVTHGDLYILDANNELVVVYNLPNHDLSEPANYDELKMMLMDATAP